MKKITLTQNQEALVDDEDYEWLSQWRWHASWAPTTKSFYAARNIRLPNGKQTPVFMHRAILGLERGDTLKGDHKNHDTLDNRRENLRIVTTQQNTWNTRNANGYYWDKRRKKYRAYIYVDGKRKFLGHFDASVDAHNAYIDAKATDHKIESQRIQP